ncbi:MAG: transporter associated domain-containing protein [bacterium]
MSDLNEVLPELLPESTSYDTLAGFLITIRGRIPTK